jgi:hypothetical protein
MDPPAQRIYFDNRLRGIFATLFASYDNGEFKKLVVDESPAKNHAKARAWENFTRDFNAVSLYIGRYGTVPVTQYRYLCRNYRSRPVRF